MSGESNVVFWLEQPRHRGRRRERVQAVFQRAKSVDRVLTEDEIRAVLDRAGRDARLVSARGRSSRAGAAVARPRRCVRAAPRRAAPTSRSARPTATPPKPARGDGPRGTAARRATAAEHRRRRRRSRSTAPTPRPALRRCATLRGRRARDADLELALALDEARAGGLDSARARLVRPAPVGAALDDTLPARARHEYPWHREQQLGERRASTAGTGTCARARAEVAARAGRWPDALARRASCAARAAAAPARSG